MSVRPHAPLLPLALAVLGVVSVVSWRWARLESLDEAAALLLALALWIAGRRVGVSGSLGLALGIIAGDWLRPGLPAHPNLLPGLEGVSSAMVLMLLAWALGRPDRSTRSDEAFAPPPVAGPQPAATIESSDPGAQHAAVAERHPPAAQDAELVGQVAHELRTPLNAMTGWLHVLDAGADFGEETIAKARGGLRRAVVQQRDLIDAVDELSRAGTGDLALARGPVDLRGVMAQSIEPALSILGEGRSPSLQRPPPGPPVWVEADADRLGRIVVDVLVAIARLCAPGTTLRLDAGVDAGEAAAAAWIAWTVVRSGDGRDAGSDALLRERIDGQATGGRRRPPPLAIRRARAIAELHGGALCFLDDASGIGLRLQLPSSALRPGVVCDAFAGGREAGLAGLRLLVVDDQEEMRDMLVTLLGQQGARVSQAEGAADALSLIGAAGEDRFDLAVLDVAMPGEDGLSLVRRIRQAERLDGRPPMGAIALTAHAGATLEREALASGFDAFLPKPLDPARLVATIRAIRPVSAA